MDFTLPWCATCKSQTHYNYEYAVRTQIAPNTRNVYESAVCRQVQTDYCYKTIFTVQIIWVHTSFKGYLISFSKCEECSRGCSMPTGAERLLLCKTFLTAQTVQTKWVHISFKAYPMFSKCEECAWCSMQVAGADRLLLCKTILTAQTIWVHTSFKAYLCLANARNVHEDADRLLSFKTILTAQTIACINKTLSYIDSTRTFQLAS